MHGVGDEDRRHGQVNRGAVQVEGVAGGHHDTGGGLGNAGVLHLRHQVRQRRFGGRGRHNQQVFASQVLHHLEDAQARHQRQHTADNENDEENTRNIEGHHHQAQLNQGLGAGATDHRRDRAECADGRHPQHHDQDAEHQFLQHGDGAQNRLALLAHTLHGESDQQGDEQGLQHRPDSQGAEQGFGNDALDEVGQTTRTFGLLGVFVTAAFGDNQARAGLHEVTYNQTDGQREGRHADEVNQG